MPQTLKHNLARALLILVILQVLLPAVLFLSVLIVRHQQKEACENYLKPSLFEKITLSTEEYTNLTFLEDREIVWQGNLYDVHSIAQQNNQYTLVLLSDKAEAKLKHISRSVSEHHGKQTNILSAFSFLYFEEMSEFRVIPFSALYSFNANTDPSIGTARIRVPAPPPDLLA